MSRLLAWGDRGFSVLNRWLSQRAFNRLLVGIPYGWLLLFFLAPLFIILKISLADPVMAAPPYTPLFDWSANAVSWIHVTLENYVFVLQDQLYRLTYLSSVKIAVISTLIILLLAYPMAYAIARAPRSRQTLLLMLVMLPFWTSFLLRIYAWIGLLNTQGLINKGLMAVGLIDSPMALLYSNFAVYAGITYSYLPFMILPLYASLENLNVDLLDAAADLGASPVRTFLDVTLPLSMPGIIAGCMLVFIPVMGEFVIPTLLGGSESLMIGRVLFEEFQVNMDWPLSSAIAVMLLLLLVVPIMILRRYQDKAASG